MLNQRDVSARIGTVVGCQGLQEIGGMQILLIDHHELFRDGLRRVLRKIPDGVSELFEAGDWKEGLRCVELHPDLDLVLLEPQVFGCDGADSVKYFRELYPHIPLVVLSSDENFHVINTVLNCGASGIIGKGLPESMLLRALKRVFAGNIHVPPQIFQHRSGNKYRLTQRQMQVLGCLTEGLSNREISEKFNLAEGTVKVHVSAIYQTLRVGSRIDAVRIARQIGLAGLPPGDQGKRHASQGRITT